MTTPLGKVLDEILPFHLLVDHDTRLKGVGRSLSRICDASAGDLVGEAARVERPVSLDLGSRKSLLAHCGQSVVLELAREHRLRGHLVPIGEDLLFAATLVLEDGEQLTRVGLSLKDFAHHDASLDSLFFQEIRRHSLDNMRETVDRLQSALAANEQLHTTEVLLTSDLAMAADIRIRTDADGRIVESHLPDHLPTPRDGEEIRGTLAPIAAAVSRANASSTASVYAEVLSFPGPAGVTFFDTRIAAAPGGGNVVVARDVTAQREEQEELVFLSLHDPLTGLANRRLFWDRAATALGRADTSLASLMVVDLDSFKGVNDVFGHTVGDEVLRTCAARIEGVVGEGNVVARLGGDEFGILIEDASTVAEAEEIARHVCARIAEPVVAEGCTVHVTGSVGIARADHLSTPDSLLRDADVAMFHGRQNGPGGVAWFDPQMQTEIRRRRELVDDLLVAIRSRQISVNFQPVVEIEDGSLAGMEALARWNHPRLGAISPEVFIPLAEQSHHIAELDRTILDMALTELAPSIRRRSMADSFRLSINLSPLSLRPSLPQELLSALGRHDLQPERLLIEITETTLLSDLAGAAEVLAGVDAIGVGVSLDDFGTGFSSLAHLHKFPISCVKIDRSFVADVAESDKVRRLVKAAVGMAEATEASVVAEGVETSEQAAFLGGIGCRYGQGFFWSRPLPADDARALLLTEAARHHRSFPA